MRGVRGYISSDVTMYRFRTYASRFGVGTAVQEEFNKLRDAGTAILDTSREMAAKTAVSTYEQVEKERTDRGIETRTKITVSVAAGPVSIVLEEIPYE